MTRPTPEVVAPLIAAALIAQQVGANAIRDGLLLSLFAVQSLPYFMIHHARTPAPPFANAAGHPLPERLEQIVLACLEKTPERRPSSAVELWRQLGELTFATPWTPERAESWWREHLPELNQPTAAGDSRSDVKIARVE